MAGNTVLSSAGTYGKISTTYMYMYIILGIRMTSLWIKTKALLEIIMGACSTIVFIVAKNSNIRHCLSFIKCIKLQATPKYYATINKF